MLIPIVTLPLLLTASSGASDTNSAPSCAEESSHAEAIMLVMKTQQDVIREVEKECHWWFDTMNREWVVKRPVAPGIMDSTHMFTVAYSIGGNIVALWSVNTAAEYAEERVWLIYATPKNIPNTKAEEKRASELSAIKLLNSQKNLIAFTDLFSVSDMRAYYGSSVWLYFNEEEWSGDFSPKTNLSCRAMAELIFPINSNDVVKVGLKPNQVLNALKDLCNTPFIREMARERGRIRLRASGDRLHWNTEEIQELILILKNNEISPPPYKLWMHAIIDLPDSHDMISLFHPLGSDLYVVGEFDVVKKSSWRLQYKKLTGIELDENSPYIDEQYCPVVDREGTLRLLERATD